MANHVLKVAMVGAGGNCGKHITQALLDGKFHTVTALARAGSKAALPAGVLTKNIDYSNPSTIVDALRGQHALVITLAGQAPPETDKILIDAAIEAGVRWILPNEWGPDNVDQDVTKDVPVFHNKKSNRDYIAARGGDKTRYVSVSTGFWYEWSLAIAPSYGFDIPNRKATFYDDGNTKITTSTWPQVGRAVAALLRLPERVADSPCLDNYANQVVYVGSFTLSQRDMFASLLRVTGTSEADWTVDSEDVKERYTKGAAAMKQGDRIGFAKMLYARIFFPDGNGDFETRRGTLNKVLGLPKEDLDEATKVAVERSKGPSWMDE